MEVLTLILLIALYYVSFQLGRLAEKDKSQKLLEDIDQIKDDIREIKAFLYERNS